MRVKLRGVLSLTPPLHSPPEHLNMSAKTLHSDRFGVSQHTLI